jgi:Tfp pilus assembly pilus retraction ATPase PilT
LRAWLEVLTSMHGSDLHLKVGSAPRVRVDGRLVCLEAPPITREVAEGMLRELIREDLYEEFQQNSEADFAYSLDGVGRFRVNAFRQRGSVGFVLRRVQVGALGVEQLGLPPVISRLAEEPRGLVLVTGPTGSGKTTTAIADPERTSELHGIIAEGGFYGMQTFDQHLVELYRDGVVSLEDAMLISSNPHDFRITLRNQGLVA